MLLLLQVDKADLCKLCVHKLPPPSSSAPSDVAAAVKATLAAASRQAGHESAAAAVEAASVEQPGDSSKQLLFLVFQHAGVANEVFAALPGTTVLYVLCSLCLYCLHVLLRDAPSSVECIDIWHGQGWHGTEGSLLEGLCGLIGKGRGPTSGAARVLIGLHCGFKGLDGVGGAFMWCVQRDTQTKMFLLRCRFHCRRGVH